MTESQASQSEIPQSRFPLQAKLTLAFVTVSLIGFVVAFLVFPRLYLQSKNRAIENSKPVYVSRLRNYLDSIVTGEKDMGSGKSLLELAKGSAKMLQDLSEIRYDRLGLEGPLNANQLLERVKTKQPDDYAGFFRVVNQITGNFWEFWLIPEGMEPLKERLSLLYSKETNQLFYPLIVPFEIPEQNFTASLVLGHHARSPLVFKPDQDSKDIFGDLNNSVGLELAANLVFFTPREIQVSEGAWEGAEKNIDKPFWERDPEADPKQSPPIKESQGEAPDGQQEVQDKERGLQEGELQRFLYIPVDRIGSPGELAGVFCFVYEPTYGLVTLQELASREAYFAFGVAALFAVIFSLFVAKSITKPVSELTEGALLIADGKLDRLVKVSSRDEIGILAATFNEMTQRLRRTLDELRDRAATIEQQNQELDRQFNELRALQNYTENILATVESAIFSVDLDGTIRRPNRATEKLLGLLDGQEIEETLTDPLREKLRAAIEEGESTFSDEILVTTPENEQIQTALSITPLREGEKILGAVAVLTDLQDIKELEALVRRQERLAALGELTAGVAHEIRNPLSIIKACADILRQKFEGQPGESGLCRDIIEEVDRLSRVVTDFLSFARPNEPNRQPVQLNESIERTVERLQRDGGMTASLELDLAESLPLVDADPDQVEQVLLNLIRNGVEAMRGEGTLSLRTGKSESESEVWIEVQDRGEGMDEETRKRLFDPFFTSKAEGTGLGLSICHRIMDSHDGSIEVLQTAPGLGTTFRVTFQAGPKEAIAS